MISEDPIKWMDGSMNMIVNTMIKRRQKKSLRKLIKFKLVDVKIIAHKK